MRILTVEQKSKYGNKNILQGSQFVAVAREEEWRQAKLGTNLSAVYSAENENMFHICPYNILKYTEFL